MLNPREQAILIWVVVLVVYALSQKRVRETTPGIMKSVFTLMIHPFFIVINTYIILAFFVMYVNKIIGSGVVKDYIVWILFALYPVIFQVSTKYTTVNIKKVFIETFKFSVIPLFIINEYTLSIWLELIMVPMIFLIGGMLVIADMDEKYKQVKTFLNYLLIIIGIVMIIAAFKGFLANFFDTSKIEFWQKMFMDFIGITLHIPLLFLIYYINIYEQILVKTNITNIFRKILAYVTIFKICKFSKQNLLKHLENYNLRQVNTIRELSDILKRSHQSETC